MPTDNGAPARLPWPRIAWFGALWIVLFFQVIVTMVKEWASDESMGHGFFVPLVVGYLVWQRRDRLMRIQPKPHWFGCVIVVFGFVCLVAGLLGADFFVMRMGLLATLYGILLSTVGMPVIRALAFPLLLLLFMIRIPLFIYSQITFPLQIFASSVAEKLLSLIGIPVLREGNVLELPSQRLSVVEACSGIRSLISLGFLSLVYGYFFENSNRIRIALFVLTVPIAILANALRVTLTGILSEVNPQLAEGVYHSLEGWVIFMVAMVSLLATHRIITLVVGRVSRNRPGAASAAKED
jgi:exosortase